MALCRKELMHGLEQYGAYHHDFRNQVVHVIFVPLLLWSGMVAVAYVDLAEYAPPALAAAFAAGGVPLNGALLTALAYSLYYVWLDLSAGATWVLFNGLPMLAAANYLFTTEPDNAWKIALGVHVLSWYLQIHIGHILFEKRKPALLDSFVPSITLAPFFVWFHIIFWLGMRSDLDRELEKRITAIIAKIQN